MRRKRNGRAARFLAGVLSLSLIAGCSRMPDEEQNGKMSTTVIEDSGEESAEPESTPPDKESQSANKKSSRNL